MQTLETLIFIAGVWPKSPGALLPAGAAAMIELLSEPLYILAQTRLLFGLRVAVETLAIITKASLTLLLLYASAAAPAVALSWAQACSLSLYAALGLCPATRGDRRFLSQIAYATVILAGYVAYFGPELLHAGRSGSTAVSNPQSTPSAEQHSSTQQDDSTPTAESTASDHAALSPPTHGMQLRKRKLQDARASTSDDSVLGFDKAAGGYAAATQLLEPHILRLCGSFTMQVRHDATGYPHRSGHLISSPGEWCGPG